MNVSERVAKIEKEISGCASLFGIDSWERNFLQSIAERSWLSEAQERSLIGIEHKIFGDPDGRDR